MPQGSILEPMLFVIFIHDLPDLVETRTDTALYGDDTKLHKNVTSTRDCVSLQQQSLSNLNHILDNGKQPPLQRLQMQSPHHYP